jgi:DNA-binding MarR family transcriptional regulator
VQRGFVHRVTDPNERRHVKLSLTEMGNDQLQQARTATLHQTATLLHTLYSEDLAQLCQSLARLKELFTAATAEPSQIDKQA